MQMKRKINFMFLFLLSILIIWNTPSFATFEIRNFNIDSHLNGSGDLSVTESITYYSDETVNGLTRKIITKNPMNKNNSADGIEFNYVMVDGEVYKSIPYGSGQKGDNGVYEEDISSDGEEIKVYSPFTSYYKTVEYNYTLKNVAVKYNDIGELYWNFIGDEWDCDILNLTINIDLPNIASTDTIYVYGHGSDNGRFEKTGNFITLSATDIDAYQSIDARILFTRDAIASSTKTVNKDVLKKYINQEEGMSSQKEKPEIFAGLKVKEIAIGLSVIIFVIAVIFYILYDKEVKVEKVKYFREMPYGLEPELLQYIYYGKMKSNSFYIAVLNLVKLGVYRLENTTNKVGKETQKLIYNANHKAQLKDYQNSLVSTINGFLTKDERGELSLDLISLSSKMERSSGSGARTFAKNLQSEKESLVGKVEKAPKKAIVSSILVMVLVIIVTGVCALVMDSEMGLMLPFMQAFLTVIYSILFASVGGAWPVLIFLIFHCSCFQAAIIAMMVQSGIGLLYIPYVLSFILIQYLTRIQKFSKEERQIIVYIAGLRRYIKDFSMLENKDSLDYISLWEDYFIMAIALGLNTKTINYFYNYGKDQSTNLGNSMHYTHSYMHFHHDMYSSFYNYQRASNISYSSGRSSGGSSFSGSSGGFSGGSSSGGGGGRRRRRRTFLMLSNEKFSTKIVD